MSTRIQDDFEDWMDQKARACGGSWFDGKVAGISHRNADQTSRQQIASTLGPYDELQLAPEPENPFDPKAVALLTPGGEQVGYLDARLAAEVTRQAIKGIRSRCFVRAVRQSGTCFGCSFGLMQYRPAAQI
jgi:hypothetical protein